MRKNRERMKKVKRGGYGRQVIKTDREVESELKRKKKKLHPVPTNSNYMRSTRDKVYSVTALIPNERFHNNFGTVKAIYGQCLSENLREFLFNKHNFL